MYHINFHTGAGNLDGIATVDEAKRLADEGAQYTQAPITIEDEGGNEIARRTWYGTVDGIDECDGPIQFGDLGFYGDWAE